VLKHPRRDFVGLAGNPESVSRLALPNARRGYHGNAGCDEQGNAK